MKASKENAREALKRMEQPSSPANDCFIREFLEAAERKLPTEATYQKEKVRSRSVTVLPTDYTESI